MNFPPHSRSKPRKRAFCVLSGAKDLSYKFSGNSNVALLLQPMLHNFSALAPINHLDRITYARNCQESRKRAFCVLSGAKDLSYAISRNSNAALLLPHLFPVSAPFASRSAPRDPLLRYSYKKMGVGGSALCPAMGLIGMPPFRSVTPSVSYHLRTSPEMSRKYPNVFYHLQTNSPVTTNVSYHLRKKGGVGGGLWVYRPGPSHYVRRPTDLPIILERRRPGKNPGNTLPRWNAPIECFDFAQALRCRGNPNTACSDSSQPGSRMARR
jgi:hypothetical protein